MSRTASARQFLLGAGWMLLAFQVSAHVPGSLSSQYALLVNALCLLVVLLSGFMLLSAMIDGEPHPLRSMGFVRRKTSVREWGLGLALGWGMVIVLLLPMMLSGHLYANFSWTAHDWDSLIVSLITVAAIALAEEIAFRGYPFQRLIEAAGESWATVLMSAIFGIVHLQNLYATPASAAAAVLFSVLCSVAYLRTRALWVSFGLNLGWTASIGVLFGLPVRGVRDFGSVIQTDASIIPNWLTGGYYGPEASVLAPLLLLAGIIVLVLSTRDYAWEYTYQPIVGAGYPMDAPPPAEHLKMEQAAKPAPLVQILPTTPQSMPKPEPPPEY